MATNLAEFKAVMEWAKGAYVCLEDGSRRHLFQFASSLALEPGVEKEVVNGMEGSPKVLEALGLSADDMTTRVERFTVPRAGASDKDIKEFNTVLWNYATADKMTTMVIWDYPDQIIPGGVLAILTWLVWNKQR